MGAGQSTSIGRVTIEQLERDSFSVVQVSDDVVRSLRGQEKSGNVQVTVDNNIRRQQIRRDGNMEYFDDKLKAEYEKLQGLLADERRSGQELRHDLNNRLHELQLLKEDVRKIQQDRIGGSIKLDVSEESKTSARVKQLEQQYAEKLAGLSAQQDELLKVQADSFRTSVVEAEQKLVRSTCEHVCSDLEGRLLQCYLDYPKQTLRCASDVYKYQASVYAIQSEREELRQLSSQQVEAK